MKTSTTQITTNKCKRVFNISISDSIFSMRFRIFPSVVSLFDSPLKIVVENAGRNSVVRLRASVDYKDSGRFESDAIYRADDNGIVNLDALDQKSIGGSYTGNHPMGLLSSLSPVAGSRKGSRFVPNNNTKAIQIKLEAFQDNQDCNNSPCSTTTISRCMTSDGVKRVEVRDGRIRGTLFIPAGVGPFPTVIDMYGTRGGLREDRASLLASHGIAALSLAIFNFEDLPKTLEKPVALEYFMEATEYLCNYPSVIKDGVGVIGVSFGAEIGALMASYSDKIKACVFINGYHMLDSFNPVSLNGHPLKTVTFDPSTYKFEDSTLFYFYARDSCPLDPESIFPVHKSPRNAKFLFLVGLEDALTCSLKSAQTLMRQLSEHGRGHNAQLMAYEGQGHILEVPYNTFYPMAYHNLFKLYMGLGGTVDGTIRAQEQAWQKIIEFFKQNLNSGPMSKIRN